MVTNYHQTVSPEITITEFWNNTSWQVVDVRSPLEFSQGKIPGSMNLPLLDNLERHEVGLLYKQYGQETALKKGYDFLTPKLKWYQEQKQGFDKGKKLAVYCARGGLRSRIMVALLRELGLQAFVVKSGFKGFRNWVLKRLDLLEIPNAYLLCGQTGVGKTLIINRLKNSLDLEGLAGHRGSLFGAIGLTPVNQKDFEANLLCKIEELDLNKPVFIEGESRKIGPVFIPPKLFTSMNKAKVILLEASPPIRSKRIVEEYINKQPQHLDEIPLVIKKLKQELGEKNITNLLELFDQKKYEECFQFILLNYYDIRYSHSMKNLTIDYTISSESIKDSLQQINKLSWNN